MKKYLSFGGGVNSVAMLIMLTDQGEDFEAVFVDHGIDWPETYKYLEMFQGWLKKNGHRLITVIKPDVQGFHNLYDYSLYHSITPGIKFRWCTDKFKVTPLHKYYQKPAFDMIGIDYSEIHRAKINCRDGFEVRYPLIEEEKTRGDCKNIIISHGLSIPIKSRCYICPFQKRQQWKELRRVHPDLFCKAEKLEQKSREYRKAQGKKPLYLSGLGGSLWNIVNEKQIPLIPELEYPPCNCMV